MAEPSSHAPADLCQAWPLPSDPRPIVIVGAGGIVRDAHLPAYRRLGLPVAGLFDLDRERARATAHAFGIERVFASMAEARAVADAVFDVAVPGGAVLDVLSELPAGAPVLIQKPMGRDLAEARAILAHCRAEHLVAALNFQLRFSPNVLALRDAIARGLLGELRDVEARVVTHTPWTLWPFLAGLPRLEILYHSIHYLDLVRTLLGDPARVQAWTGKEPGQAPEFAETRSTSLLDYGPALRAVVHTNHGHTYGSRQGGADRAVSELTVEGMRGAAHLRLGVNLDYPHGLADTLELACAGGPWEDVPLRGSWFTEAFEGPMSSLQRFVAGEDDALPTSVEDAVRTMELVEACYASAGR